MLSRNDSPDLGFRWSVNPYRGCFHACAYCYARRTHEYLGLGAGTDFDRKIFVKPDAPALLARAFARRSWRRELVAFSGVTDCYQPLEAAWKLTRRCLEVCAEYGNPAGIVTKSALVRRDADVLQHLAQTAGAHVSVSIAFLDEDTARRLEPGAPTLKRRFETLRTLADAGVPVGVAVAPIIPGLNDADVPRILERAAECGATSAFPTVLRLPGSVKDVFLKRLAEELPLRAGRVERRIRDVRGGRLNDSRFGSRHRAGGPYGAAIHEMWALWTRRAGLRTRDYGAIAEEAGGPARRAAIAPVGPGGPPAVRPAASQIELSL